MSFSREKEDTVDTVDGKDYSSCVVCPSTILLQPSPDKSVCAPKDPRYNSEEVPKEVALIKLIVFQVIPSRQESRSMAPGLRRQDEVPDRTILRAANQDPVSGISEGMGYLSIEAFLIT